jgi:hypothetical protein
MKRQGVSLLEVLVSIGVASIGLLGVATLLPLAFRQAESGARNDRKALVGKRAFREAHVLGILQPSRWVELPVRTADPDPPVAFVDLFDDDGVRYAFCIDPRARDEGRFNEADPLRRHFFPMAPTVGNPPRVQMWRVSLRSVPGGPAMSVPHADELFIVEDDLQFEYPKQQTEPPIQTTLRGPLNEVWKRSAEGHFSWFVTLVPEPHVSDPLVSDPHVSGLYKMSTVVTYQRVAPYNEYTLRRVSPLGVISYAGGDIQLEEAIPVDPGEWVMLGRKVAVEDPIAQEVRYHPRFEWYRVVAVDGVNLTLQGADWEFSAFPLERTQVTYVPNVVAVYQKTVRLETSSLWTR